MSTYSVDVYNTKKEKVAQVELDGRGGTLVVKEQCFPGWGATVGEATVTLGCTEDGLLSLPIAEGARGPAHLRYGRTAAEVGGMALGLVALAGLWLPLLSRRWRAGRPAGPPPPGRPG